MTIFINIEKIGSIVRLIFSISDFEGASSRAPALPPPNKAVKSEMPGPAQVVNLADLDKPIELEDGRAEVRCFSMFQENNHTFQQKIHNFKLYKCFQLLPAHCG